MSETKAGNSSSLRVLPGESNDNAHPDASNCWRTIGVWGDRSCEVLTSLHLCVNCDVYRSIQARLLAREMPDFDAYEDCEAQSASAARDSLFLCATISEHAWAFPLSSLSRVAPPQQIHSLPHTRNILGLTAIDGQLLPVIDLASILLRQQSAVRENGWFLLFSLSDGLVAAQVDSLLGVTAITPNEMTNYPETGKKSLPLPPIGIAKIPSQFSDRHTVPTAELLVTDATTLEKRLRVSLMG